MDCTLGISPTGVSISLYRKVYVCAASWFHPETTARNWCTWLEFQSGPAEVDIETRRLLPLLHATNFTTNLVGCWRYCYENSSFLMTRYNSFNVFRCLKPILLLPSPILEPSQHTWTWSLAVIYHSIGLVWTRINYFASVYKMWKTAIGRVDLLSEISARFISTSVTGKVMPIFFGSKFSNKSALIALFLATQQAFLRHSESTIYPKFLSFSISRMSQKLTYIPL